MKNTTFFLLLVLFGSVLLAQDRIPLKGKLLYKNTDVVAANVINNTALSSTITDALGEFEIEVKEGDELIFSAVNIRIKALKITSEIIAKKRLVVSVTENITALNEVVITPENTEKFLDLKEEEFKGFDYTQDKSTKVINKLADDRQLTNGLDLVNLAKLLAKALSNKTEEEKMKLKPSEILPYVFEDSFFEQDLALQKDEVVGFLEFIDTQLKSSDLLKQSQQFLLIDYLIEKSRQYKKNLAQ
ncbi:MAG: hypothetical protein ACPGVF_05795 [Flavobacteriaceae bacterium]